MPSTHKDIDPIQLSNNSSWDHVIDQLESSSSNDIDHTLNVSSGLYEQLGKTLIRLLQIRVENLIAVGRLSEALEDTSIMRQLRPASPLGYLFEADILSSMQGLQEAALSIIDHGIHTASKANSNYLKLLESKNRIREKQHLRIDLIKKLPIDIVRKRIAPLLLTSSMKDEVINVSSIWQQRFAPVFGMHVEIRDAQDWTTGHRRIIEGAPWIKSLSLKHCQQSPYTLLQRREFRSLEKLRIQGKAAIMRILRLIYLHALMHRLSGAQVVEYFKCRQTLDTLAYYRWIWNQIYAIAKLASHLSQLGDHPMLRSMRFGNINSSCWTTLS